MGSRTCGKCGNRMRAHAQYCPRCGDKVEPLAREEPSSRRLRVVAGATVAVSLLTLVPLLVVDVPGHTVLPEYLAGEFELSFPGLARMLLGMASYAPYLGEGPLNALGYYIGALVVIGFPALAIARSVIGCCRAFRATESTVPAGLATSFIVFLIPVAISFASGTVQKPTVLAWLGLVLSFVLLLYVLASAANQKV